jgi:hypothetical protein
VTAQRSVGPRENPGELEAVPELMRSAGRMTSAAAKAACHTILIGARGVEYAFGLGLALSGFLVPHALASMGIVKIGADILEHGADGVLESASAIKREAEAAGASFRETALRMRVQRR